MLTLTLHGVSTNLWAIRVAAWTTISESAHYSSRVGDVFLTFEDRLWFCGERNGGLKWIFHAMFSKNFEKLGRARIGIDDNIGVRDLDTKAIRGEIFAILNCRMIVNIPSLTF